MSVDALMTVCSVDTLMTLCSLDTFMTVCSVDTLMTVCSVDTLMTLCSVDTLMTVCSVDTLTPFRICTRHCTVPQSVCSLQHNKQPCRSPPLPAAGRSPPLRRTADRRHYRPPAGPPRQPHCPQQTRDPAVRGNSLSALIGVSHCSRAATVLDTLQ